MQPRTVVVAFGLLSGTFAITGKTYTGWDCCKPGCAWSGNLNRNIRGSPMVCDINNRPLSNGLTAKSGCDNDGKAFLCQDYAPMAVAANESLGFALMFDPSHCCRCYSLTWTSGAASGKTMIVQAISTAESGSLSPNDIVIQTPAGGSGGNDQGCRAQYGTNWGKQGGGVNTPRACQDLPQNLQGGCYWRFNWGGGDMEAWNINYREVSCPSRLTQISGCSPS